MIVAIIAVCVVLVWLRQKQKFKSQLPDYDWEDEQRGEHLWK